MQPKSGPDVGQPSQPALTINQYIAANSADTSLNPDIGMCDNYLLSCTLLFFFFYEEKFDLNLEFDLLQ